MSPPVFFEASRGGQSGIGAGCSGEGAGALWHRPLPALALSSTAWQLLGPAQF
jgi:hypothetical protein